MLKERMVNHQLPKGWQAKPLVQLCTLFTDGDWIESKDQSLDGIRLIQTGNVGCGEFKDRRDKARWISQETFEKLKCEEVFPDDCLISRLPDPVGRSCLIPETGDKMITSVDCSIIRLNRSFIIADFFNYYTQSAKYLEEVESKCSGATRKRISRKNLGEVEILLPPLPEQKRIVAILDEAFANISQTVANAEKNLANARELFDSYLNEVFTHKGEGWEEKYLSDGELLKIIDGDRGSNYPTASEFFPEEYCLFLSTKNVRPDGFKFNETMFITKEKDQALRKGKLQRLDVVLTTRGTIGNVAIYDEKVDFENIRINSGMLIFRPNQSLILSEYLFEVLRSNFIKKQINASVSGAAQPQLPIKTINNFKIPVHPSIEKQKFISNKIKKLSCECEELEDIYRRKLAALAELKQALLQKAFTGELTAADQPT
ncbi:restriction endonuclease subunit S [Thiothrix unzii]|uniref:Restriction endonuclease subunit S n=1 Tax=Thiothrix unzii TaxID=111769 RepID=A0A975FCS9_9GAMM|nr:restriction endonuclease subunit S [Thiothrix unzii]QTR55183.1 restriction endonuclease subunit S [Thiothrix unzii]